MLVRRSLEIGINFYPGFCLPTVRCLSKDLCSPRLTSSSEKHKTLLDTPTPIAIVTVAGQVLRDGQFSSVSLDHLELEQRGQLSSLLIQYKDVFDDKPG